MIERWPSERISRRSVLIGAVGLAGEAGADPASAQTTSANFAPGDPAVVNWIDARPFGVVGDGKHDDTDALERALAHVGRLAMRNTVSGIPGVLQPRGGVLYLPPGQYRISHGLEVGPNTILQGSGPMSTLIVLVSGGARHADHPEPMLRVGTDVSASATNRAANARLKRRAGSGQPAAAGYELLGLEPGVTGVRIRDLSLLGQPEDNPGSAGILWNAGVGCSIERVSIEAGAYGVRAVGAQGPICIEDVWILAGSSCIEMAQYGCAWIAGAAMSGEGTGLRMQSVGPVTVAGCRYTGDSGAIFVQDAVAGFHGVSAETTSAAAQTALESRHSTIFVSSLETLGYGLALIDEDPVWARVVASPTEQTRVEAYAGQNNFVASQGSGPYPVFGPLVARINCGGSEIPGWNADHSFNGGVARQTNLRARRIGTPLSGPVELYSTIREGPISYTLQAPPGPALVRLHFAEERIVPPGERRFDVHLNGRLRRAGLDVARETLGSVQTFVIDLPLADSAGSIALQLVPVHGSPFLSGLEVYSLVGAKPADTAPQSTLGGMLTPDRSLFAAWTSTPPRSGTTMRLSGAGGSGIVDDGPVIQRHLDNPGVDLFLPAGTYYCSAALSLTPGTRLRGAGFDRTVLLFSGSVGGPLLHGSGAGILIEDLTIATAPGQTPRGPGVALDNAFDAGLTRLRLANVTEGILLRGCQGTRLRELQLTVSGTGIAVESSSMTSVVCARIDGYGAPSIRFRNGSSHLRITALVSNNVGAMLMTEDGHDLLIEGATAVSPAGGSDTAISLGGPVRGLVVTHLQTVGFRQAVKLTQGNRPSSPAVPGSAAGIGSYSLYLSSQFAWRRVTGE